ncbi:MAG: exodeoxyribonuclease VII small subunit [Clostridiales bacterium]|nr:exodeoxyribonuclease VII small subunit [Clostridiales bacterium]
MAAKRKTFEESMLRLEEIVTRLEKGEATLEESMALFEEGTKLAAACAKQLDSAEQKVLKLTGATDGAPVEQAMKGE